MCQSDSKRKCVVGRHRKRVARRPSTDKRDCCGRSFKRPPSLFSFALVCPPPLGVWKILLVYGSESEFQSRNQSNLNDPDPCSNVATMDDTQFVDLCAQSITTKCLKRTQACKHRRN